MKYVFGTMFPAWSRTSQNRTWCPSSLGRSAGGVFFVGSLHSPPSMRQPKVDVGLKTAYDLYLTREIKRARLVRAATSKAAIEQFLEEGFDAAAGVRQPLQAAALQHPGYRVLAESFMVIRQAMGLPIGRGEAANAFLAAFVEAMKTSGFVAEALRRHGIDGVSVAP